MIKVKFIISPIGAFGLAYAQGMEAWLNEGQAELLIESGYAIEIEREVPEKQVTEKRKK